MSRPRLLKVRLYYAVADSPVPLEVELDAARFSSLYFDEHASVEILGGFYDGQKKHITKDEAIARFGIRAEAWFPAGKTEVPLDKAFMKKAWGDPTQTRTKREGCGVDARADAETLPFMIVKDPSCYPSGYP